jgi:hypothetical protein
MKKTIKGFTGFTLKTLQAQEQGAFRPSHDSLPRVDQGRVYK